MEYTKELQKLFLEMFLADAESFVRAQNIFKYSHYDAHLREAAKFIYEYANEYKTLPDVEMVNAKTGADLQSAADIDPKHFDWFLDEYERFARHKSLESAILASADMLEKGEYGSVEDKINRFADKERHQVFVEPEGWSTVEVYVNGFSTSLPEDIQFNALKSVPGFEDVKFFRPGYAIEYDYFPPTQLKHSLETKPIENLFFAGQINGTTGYEEAAAQGLMAGINAHLKIKNKPEFILKRNQAYIGVLIDDLITKGTEEPYRMFTSRAEFRMLLRQDNADIRLTELSHSIGLASNDRYNLIKSKLSKTKKLIDFITKLSVLPSEMNPILENKNSKPISQSMKLKKLYCRPNIISEDVLKIKALNDYINENSIDEEIIEQSEIQIKYSGYIDKEKSHAEKLNNLESVKIPLAFDYSKLKSLSSEAKSKLEDIKPRTLSQASRISGVSPADISAMLVFMGR